MYPLPSVHCQPQRVELCHERDIWRNDGILVYHRIYKRIWNINDRADTCRAETPSEALAVIVCLLCFLLLMLAALAYILTVVLKGRPMGKHKLFCVFGTYELNNHSYADIDGLCDYAFITFFARDQDNFEFHGTLAIWQLLNMSEVAKTTSFGINVALRGVRLATAQLNTSDWAVDSVRAFWRVHKIYHYGVLDLEVKPWDNSIESRIKEVFELFKLIRVHQEKLKGEFPPVPPWTRGFLVLGIRLWPANMEPFLAEIDKAFKRWFNVDGLIPLTHINEDEFIAGYPQCWISGGAPYRLAPNSNNSNVLGMVKTMEAINLRAWYWYPSLAVSVSMCTRVYKAQAAVAMDAPCVASNWGVNTTLCYCNSLNPYENPTVDATQNVVVGTSKSVTAKDALSTFESHFTINSKYCDINKMFGRLDLGLALFDIECEDWMLECPAPTAGISGTKRFRNVSNHTHKLARMGVANACP
ncbi:hypothetical protein MTO96_009435 [Rhipicephalus appendiculatus]